MSRKSALMLLVLVALWAARPALACLAAPAPLPCCQQMMQGCDDSAAMASMVCCQSHAPEDAVPPAAAAPLAAAVLAAHVDARLLAIPAIQPGAGVPLQSNELLLASSPPGFSSILRI